MPDNAFHQLLTNRTDSPSRTIPLNAPFVPGLNTFFWIAFLALMLIPQGCLCLATNESVDAAGKITVTDAVIEPSVLMTGDVGLVTFTVENTGENNVVVSDAQLISKEITVLNSDIYKSSRTIGAGTKMKYSFTILADQPENIYYPAFYLNFRDAGSLRYNIPVRVEEPQLAISVAGIPENYTKGVMSRIILQLGNAKSVNITGVTVVPSGQGIQCNRTSLFIGDIGPHAEKSLMLEIIPSVPTTLTFNVSYTCGMNSHHTSYAIPILLGDDKLAADPILNNIEVTTDTSGKMLAGDISNAGLTDAYGVVVSVAQSDDATENPNQKYAIGTIASGDFESFELTIPQGSKKIPLLIQYKDSSGNIFARNISLDLDQIAGSSTGPGSQGTSGGPPGSAAGSGTQSGSTSASGSGRSGVNPMNPLSGLGKGMDGVPFTEILIGGGILILVAGLWLVWRRKLKGRKITFSFK
jgi:hypothetical protein